MSNWIETSAVSAKKFKLQCCNRRVSRTGRKLVHIYSFSAATDQSTVSIYIARVEKLRLVNQKKKKKNGLRRERHILRIQPILFSILHLHQKQRSTRTIQHRTFPLPLSLPPCTANSKVSSESLPDEMQCTGGGGSSTVARYRLHHPKSSTVR